MNIIYTQNAPEPVGPYSQGIEHNGFYYFSGQIATSSEGKFYNDSLEEEINQIFKNITALLKETGLQKENIIKTTVFLIDMNDFQKVNEIYAEFFGEHRPTRSAIEVSKLPLGARIEIEIIAIK